jgi:flavin-dependent dehydrogenase
LARIAIIGAGPAGSSAGYHLARRGHAVALIDRAEFPRNKTCGDWITPIALQELADMGVDGPALDRCSPGRPCIQGSILASPDGRRSEQALRAPGTCIPRRIFDDLLRERAVAAGCEPMRRTVRDLLHGDGEFLRDFDHVIDARGAHAGAPNAVALRAYWTVRREGLGADFGADLASRVQIHTDAEYRRGYGWIFPVQTDAATVRFNIGVGLWKADSRLGHSVADYFDRFVRENSTVRPLREAAQQADKPVGYHVALARWRNRVATDGILRIGDAANLADPLTGDGIGNALSSGRLVADAIGDAQRTGASRARAAVEWQRLFDRKLATDLRAALALRQSLVPTAAKNLANRLLLAPMPRVRARLHAAIFGETAYRDVWS